MTILDGLKKLYVKLGGTIDKKHSYDDIGRLMEDVADVITNSVGGYKIADVSDLPSSIATFTDGSALPMLKLQVGIEPQQDLHGYDAPWVGGAGKNKFDSDTALSALTKNNNKYVGKPESVVGSYVISGGFKTNTRYTFSYKAYNNTSTPSNFRFVFLYTDGTEEIIGGFVDTTTEKVMVRTSAENKTISKIIRNYGNGVELTLYDIQLEEGSTATSYEPYSNECPISGFTEANVVVSPTTDAEDGTTYNIQFKDGDNPLTVYGGSLDVVSGELTVDRAYVDLGTLNWGKESTEATVLYTGITGKKTGISPMICDRYKYVSDKGFALDFGSVSDSSNASYVGTTFIRNSDFAGKTAVECATLLSGTHLVYELATPLTYQLTPTLVKSLLNTNNVWHSCNGGITDLTYFSKA